MLAAPHDSVAEVRAKERKIRSRHNIPDSEPVVLLEIELRDPSMFAEPLEVRGREFAGEHVLAVRAVSVANAIAVISLAMQRDTGLRPTVYFEWSPGGPLREALRSYSSAAAKWPPSPTRSCAAPCRTSPRARRSTWRSACGGESSCFTTPPAARTKTCSTARLARVGCARHTERREWNTYSSARGAPRRSRGGGRSCSAA